jgi:hypothetical protein
MGQDIENFAEAFIVSLEKAQLHSLKMFLFLGQFIAMCVRMFLVYYVHELGWKYVVEKRIWNSHSIRVDQSVRLPLELFFICRCCNEILKRKKLFTRCFVAAPHLAIFFLPEIIASCWLSWSGIFYLMAVSYQDNQSILMDALTFELVFDAEKHLYEFSAGKTRGYLNRLNEHSDEPERHESNPLTIGPARWWMLRMAIPAVLTYVLDTLAHHIADQQKELTTFERCINLVTWQPK